MPKKLFFALLMSIALASSYSGAVPQPQLRMEFADSKRFIAAHGRYAWAGGYADAGLEVWAGALQIASDIRPEFRRAGDVTSIPGRQIISKIAVTPASASRTYTGPDFSVEEEVRAPLDKAAVLVRYTVRSVRPVQVIVRFRPSLNLMWPAALGGQEIHWEASESRYLLIDSARQFAAVLVAPGATAHDEPLNSAREIPQTDELAIALDPKAPQILFARVDPGQIEKSSKDLASLLQANSWQEQVDRHFDDVLSSAIEVETPDMNLNRALAWAEVALDQDWFCSESLGCAYVAGFGPSRRNRRPQYAWFFAGDGMIAVHAAMAKGEYQRARDEIRFIAKYQDEKTGMIWHELSQSAPYIPWREKYPYMFVHADMTYPYISTVADYVRVTNDRPFMSEIWPSVEKAFTYGRSLISEDGLPRIPAGKEGPDEQNALSDESGLSASWVAACADYAHLAEMTGHAQGAQEAKSLAEKARHSFVTRYWDSERNFPIEGYRRSGEPMLGRGLGALSAVNLGLFREAQINRILNQLTSWRFQSDWGTRSVAMGDPGFDPTGYGHGSVWALGTADAAEALWKAHRSTVAWQVWRTLIPWASLDSPGHMHEVLAGDTFHPQLESVPEQSWSSAAFLTTGIQGLFGLEIDSETGAMILAPHLPADWDHAALRNVKVEESVSSFTFQQSLDSLKLHIEHAGTPQHISFRPTIPIGARDVSVNLSGKRVTAQLIPNEEEQEVMIDLTVPPGSTDIDIRFEGAIGIVLPEANPSLGNFSAAMKLNSAVIVGNTLRIEIDAVSGSENTLQLRTQREILSADHAKAVKLSPGVYNLRLVSGPDRENYQHQQVTVTFSK
jgi:hypothetical protein